MLRRKSLVWLATRRVFRLACHLVCKRQTVQVIISRFLNRQSAAMHNKSDPVFEQYANLDFAGAKPVVEAPALAELQGNGRRVALCENGGASLSTEAYGLWNKPVTDGITYQAQIREEW